MTTAQFTAPPAYPRLVVGGTEIDLQISSDPTVGFQLDFIRSKVGVDFDHITKLVDSSVADEDLDGRMWQITYTREGESAPDATPVGPAQATSVASFDVTAAYGSTAEALLFVWSGVAIPRAADEDTLQVSVLMRMDTNDQLSHWNIWVTREHGSSVAIDEVEFPVLWIKGPATPVGGESHLEGQKRSRVLTPFNAMPLTTSPTMAPVSSLFEWASPGLSSKAPYPAPNQVMQFAAVAGVHDPGDNSWRRPLFMMTEDLRGRPRYFNYRGYNYLGGGADDGYLRFSVGHIPSFVEDLGDKTHDTEFGNSYEMPFDFTLGVRFASAAGIIWYDVAEHYRDRIVAIGAMPLEIESNPDLISGINRQPGLWLGSIQQNLFEVVENAELFEGYHDYLETMRVATRGVQSPLPNVWMQYQTWLKGTVLDNPARLIFGDQTYAAQDGLNAILEREFARGVIGIGYTRPGDLLRAMGWITPRGVLRVGRDKMFETVPGGVRLDSSTTMAQWWADNLTRIVRDVGFRGHYNDGLASGPSRLSYPAGGGEHPRHGGRWMADAQASQIDAIRLRLNDVNSSIGTEAVSEPLSSKTNIQQEAVFYYPGEGLLMEEAEVQAVTEVPTQARHVAPPMWQTVYHNRHPSHYLGFHMGNCLLASNGDWYPSQGKSGLGSAEFIDLFSWLYGSIWAHGNVPFLLQCQFDFDGHDTRLGSGSGVSNKILLRNNVGSTFTSLAKDPTSAGREIMAFLRLMTQWLKRDQAGDFVMFGQLLQPLVPDYTTVDNSRQTNPMSALDLMTKVDLTAGRSAGMLPGTLFVAFIANAALLIRHTSTGFEVPDAVYQLWRSPEGIVGLVVVNWSASSATFNATFDPAIYGVTTPYDVFQRQLGSGKTLVRAGIGAGDNVLGNSGIVDTTLPTFAARSVNVFTFEPA